MTLLRNVDIKAQNSPSVDAFGRWRVSGPTTLFDSKQLYDNQPLLWDDSEVSGTGTSSSHSVATAATTIGVSASTAGKRVRQTKMRMNYQPGKSQLVLMTTKLTSAATTGIDARVGLFDDDNGLYFRASGGVVYVGIRSSTSGSAVDTEVAQSSWNVDKLDGTGPSGITLDPTKCQILGVDYEWLGVGRVRFFIVSDSGDFVTCHVFKHANAVDNVYMSTPNLPLRYEIENDGTGGAVSLVHICSSVVSEGGQEPTGQIRYKSTAGTAVTASTENVIYAVVGLKLKAANVSATVDILETSIQIQTASEMGEWTLRLNPTVAGTFTYGNETNSSLMSATGATANTVTGGTILAGGFGYSSASAGGSSGATRSEIKNSIKLGAAIDGTVDEIVLCWMPNGGTSAHDVEGSITWRESL